MSEAPALHLRHSTLARADEVLDANNYVVATIYYRSEVDMQTFRAMLARVIPEEMKHGQEDQESKTT